MVTDPDDLCVSEENVNVKKTFEKIKFKKVKSGF